MPRGGPGNNDWRGGVIPAAQLLWRSCASWQSGQVEVLLGTLGGSPGTDKDKAALVLLPGAAPWSVPRARAPAGPLEFDSRAVAEVVVEIHHPPGVGHFAAPPPNWLGIAKTTTSWRGTSTKTCCTALTAR